MRRGVRQSGQDGRLFDQLDAIRAGVLARAERRFRGLTATEHELVGWTTQQLVNELVRALDADGYTRGRWRSMIAVKSRLGGRVP